MEYGDTWNGNNEQGSEATSKAVTVIPYLTPSSLPSLHSCPHQAVPNLTSFPPSCTIPFHRESVQLLRPCDQWYLPDLRD